MTSLVSASVISTQPSNFAITAARFGPRRHHAMASRHVFSSTRRIPKLRHVTAHRSLATASPTGRLHEYVVIIHYKAGSIRPVQTSLTPPSLQKLSFVGNILGKNPDDIRGDMLACQASSQEEIQSKLKAHPFAKDVWDMNSVSILPFETVHNCPIEDVEA